MEKEHNNNVDENLNDQKKTENTDSKLNTSIPEKEVKNEENDIENPDTIKLILNYGIIDEFV